MKKKKPLVSVIMPVYNAGFFLRQAIESILNQTYPHFELIIIDDASTDHSWPIISQFKKQNPGKIKVIRLKTGLKCGGDAAANLGFQKAKGQLIARMDADDLSLPQRLEKQVNYLQKHPDVFMVGSCAWVIDQTGQIVGQKNVPLTHKEIYQHYSIFHPMIHPSVMIRKSAVKRKNLYKIKYSANNDLLTFFEFLKTKKFVNLPEKLVCYRIHGQNDSLTKIKEKYFNTLKIRILAGRKYGYRPPVKAVVLNLVQLVTVSLLPEKLIFLTYMLAKGIYSYKELGESFLLTFQPLSLKLKLKNA